MNPPWPDAFYTGCVIGDIRRVCRDIYVVVGVEYDYVIDLDTLSLYYLSAKLPEQHENIWFNSTPVDGIIATEHVLYLDGVIMGMIYEEHRVFILSYDTLWLVVRPRKHN